MNKFNDHSESHLTTIYAVKDPVQATLIKNMLFEFGIKSELAGEQQGGFTGALGIGIIVRESDAKAALKLIQLHSRES